MVRLTNEQLKGRALDALRGDVTVAIEPLQIVCGAIGRGFVGLGWEGDPGRAPFISGSFRGRELRGTVQPAPEPTPLADHPLDLAAVDRLVARGARQLERIDLDA